ncbi:MAG: helicase-related protein [Candidatus Micrarchaeaceae archaeon]
MAIDERWNSLGDAARQLNLEGIEFREYQTNIIKAIQEYGNTLVVLPTGLGKTIIAAGTIAYALSAGKKALFLAPTKPLVEQHYKSLIRLLSIDANAVMLLTGSTAKAARKDAEVSAKVIIATPQTVANDLKAGALSMEGFGVTIFDECHRAVGRYAYTYIANECQARGIMIAGLTASPGGKKERINALVRALGIRHIEARISTDSDVAKYVMPKNIHIVNVELNQRIKQIAAIIKPEIYAALARLHKLGLFHFSSFESIPKGRLIELGNQIGRMPTGNYKYAAMFSYTKLLNLIHAYDLLVVEGIYPFLVYLESLYGRKEKSRTLESLLKSGNLLVARNLAKDAIKNGEEHPKAITVIEILMNYRGRRVILFAQYRSTIKMLVEYLNNNGFPARPFVGKKEGVTQEQQKQVIEEFRNGAFDVLVSSSIGEEGMDIPGVEVVLFYEAIPNEIRNIQRRGRTGRFAAGEIYMLIASGTKDQIYLHVSRMREQKMLNTLSEIEARLRAAAIQPHNGQHTLA